jgi:protein-disulfide isomerase
VLYASPDLRFLSRELLDSRVNPSEQEQREQQVLSAGLTQGNFPVLGPAGAPVTLTVFSDFQCPYCARLATVLKQDVLPAEGERVRVVFRHFPLPMHRWALAAAEAAACAQEQGNHHFWALHDFIFEHQRELSAEDLKERLMAHIKKQPRLDKAKFEACLLEQRTVPSIEKDLAFGREIGVQGTPTIFVNAHRLGSVSSAGQIRSLIRQYSEPDQRASAR